MKAKPTIVANWKMNLLPRDAQKLSRELALFFKEYPSILSVIDLVVCPSFESIQMCRDEFLKKKVPLRIGAQDCSQFLIGAHTGDVSVASLVTLGCTSCIIGHSERRHGLDETDIVVRKKLQAVLAAPSMTPVLCIGETKKQRREGYTRSILAMQLRRALSGISWNDHKKIVIAYEPVWAIGGKQPLAPLACAEISSWGRTYLSTVLPKNVSSVFLYGGSVTADTVSSFIDPKISNGVLIGGASASFSEFKKILLTLSRKLS